MTKTWTVTVPRLVAVLLVISYLCFAFGSIFALILELV
jgi:hypothetical protein